MTAALGHYRPGGHGSHVFFPGPESCQGPPLPADFTESSSSKCLERINLKVLQIALWRCSSISLGSQGAGSAYLGWLGRVELGTGKLATKPCVLEVEHDASMNDPV